MRRLIHIPIIHTPEETIYDPLTASPMTRFAAEKSYPLWNRIHNYFANSSLPIAKLKVYQDTLPFLNSDSETNMLIDTFLNNLGKNSFNSYNFSIVR